MNQHVQPAPFLLDRWQDQIDLEKEMLALGTERMQEKINKAHAKFNLTGLRPHRSLIYDWVLPISEGITEYLNKTSTGPQSAAMSRLRMLSADTAAMVAIKAVVQMLGFKTPRLTPLASQIGTWCEHEARAALWKEELADDWRLTQAGFKARGSTSPHQRRATIALWNKYIADKVGWLDWTSPDRIRVGLELIDIVIQRTGRFRLAADPDWVPKRVAGGGWTQPPVVLMADEGLQTWLKSAMDDELVYAPAYMPCVIPPRPWDDVRGGGYWTPFVNTPVLVGIKAHHRDVQGTALEDFGSYDMEDVYSAVNFIQETGWAINKRVLDVALHVWDQDLAIAGFPREEEEQTRAPPHQDRTKQDWKDWAKETGDIKSRNAQRIGGYISYRRTIELARRMRDEPVFYFPHKLDFRGRMYPIPTDLSPQGHDLHRGLLTFAEAKPVGEEDVGWLAIQVANAHGTGGSYDDRIAWVYENERRWRDISADPLEDRSWAEEDDPWQCLAAILEWVRYLDEGVGMMSSLPIRVDGTCNGIQHLSAMVRDEVGGASVNLVPGDAPRDIYSDVAAVVTEALRNTKHLKWSKLWLAVFGGAADRSVTKTPVMILPYGGTKDAYFLHTRAWLKKHDPEEEHISKADYTEAVKYLVEILYSSVVVKVEKALEVMRWIQACCKRTSEVSAPLYWVTPVGFVVRHFYGTMESKRIKTNIDGQVLNLRYNIPGKKLDVASQGKGIAPNFTHSMDGSALMTCANYARGNGVTSMTTIHDSYGTVAADMNMLSACLREAFVATYRTPVLENFLKSCKRVAGADGEWPPLPEFGTLNLEDILKSEYFFA